MPMHFDWENRTGGQELQDLPAQERNLREKAQDRIGRIANYVETAKEHLERAQQRMTDQANRGRREPDFDVGDYVFIWKKRQTWATDRPADKLDYPMTQQKFKIKARDGDTFELEVPPSWRATNKYHADRLRKYPNNPLPGQESENPEGEIIQPDGEEEFTVERIRASRLYYRRLQYKVDWKGWDIDDEWYSASNFKNSAKLIKEFHDVNPESAGPPLRLAVWLEKAENDEFDESHPDDDKVEVKLVRASRRRLANR